MHFIALITRFREQSLLNIAKGSIIALSLLELLLSLVSWTAALCLKLSIRLTFLGLHLCGGHDCSSGCWGRYCGWSDHGSDACSWSGFIPGVDGLLAGCSDYRRWLNVGSWRLRGAGTDTKTRTSIKSMSELCTALYSRFTAVLTYISFSDCVPYLPLSAAGVGFRLICLCSVVLCCSWV